jgi:hypothetical protein
MVTLKVARAHVRRSLRGQSCDWVCPLGLAGWLFDSAPSVPRIMARAKCSGLNIGQDCCISNGAAGMAGVVPASKTWMPASGRTITLAASNDEVEKPVAQPANSGLKATQLFKISRFAGQILQRSHSFGEIC